MYNAFIVSQLQSMVKFLMYDTNIFVHLQIYHDKALYNKSNIVNASSQIAQCKN